ncbi:MAG: VOC family protein [Thermodesulfobacteriota bacterium]
MTSFNGIHHLALVTRDMDMTIRYWRDLLGLRLVAGLGDGRYRHYFFALSETDMVAFFEWPDAEPLPPKDHGVPSREPRAFDHVSFGVDSEDELWALKDRIEAAGFWVSEVIDHGFIHSIYTFDPNHIPIEFSAPVPGVDVRRHPKMKDKAPCRAAREGPEPQPGQWPPVIRPTATADRTVFPGEGTVLAEEPGDRQKNEQSFSGGKK